MPMAHMHSACFHCLCIVRCATLNLLATAMMDPLLRWSSVAVISNMEIASKHILFVKSILGGLQCDASSLQTSSDSIIHSNQHSNF